MSIVAIDNDDDYQRNRGSNNDYYCQTTFIFI